MNRRIPAPSHRRALTPFALCLAWLMAACGTGASTTDDASTVTDTDALVQPAPDVTAVPDVAAPTPDVTDAAPDVAADAPDDVPAPDALDASTDALPDAPPDASADVAPDGFVPLPTLSIADTTVTEGDTATTTASFTVTLSAPAAQTVTVHYATTDGTATTAPTAIGGSDYSAANGTLVFAPGDTMKTVSVLVGGDTTDESDEQLTVTLSAPVRATLARAVATGTITDDDAAPSLSIADVTVTEGNTGTTPAVFTVRLSAASGRDVSVTYATTDGTGLTGATAPSDYTAITATALAFAPGETSKTVSVDVAGDTAREESETFSVQLTDPLNATVMRASATATIENDDGSTQPVLTITPAASVTEGDTGTHALTFTVTPSFAPLRPVTVAYASADGTAATGGNALAGGTDYTAVSGTLAWDAGDATPQTITVLVNGDTVNELDETLTVTLSAATDATIAAGGVATGTITDDDALPTLVVSDAAVDEGSSGQRALMFTVTLMNGAMPATSGRLVTATYATTDGTGPAGAITGGVAATGGHDYASATGAVRIQAGVTSQQVIVFVNGDTLNEANDTLALDLSAPVAAALGDGHAVGTITNDDPLPLIHFDNAQVIEGNTGNTNVTFYARLVDAAGAPVFSGQTVTANYATANGIGTDAATLADRDFVAANGAVTFAPGQAARPVVVQVVGDMLAEANETFRVVPGTRVNAALQSPDTAAMVTIENDDGAAIFVRVADGRVTEGNTGTTARMTFTVTLSRAVPVGQTISVQYATAATTASGTSTATAGADYTAVRPTTLTFAAGETTKTFTVSVTGDNVDEDDEYFYVVLSNPSTGAALQTAQGTGYIADDDASPTFTVTSPSGAEANTGSHTVTFTANLSTASQRVVRLGYVTTDGTAQTAGTAVAGGHDYLTASGDLTFAAGVTAQSFTVTVYGDTTYEPNETFGVTVSGTNGTTTGTATGTATVTNDDALPVATVAAVTHAEGTPAAGRTGTTAYVFTVTLANTTSVAATVGYDTRDETAVSTGTAIDYVGAHGTLMFAPGDRTKTFTVTVNQDATVEPTETFLVDFARITSVASPIASVRGTITNDD